MADGKRIVITTFGSLGDLHPYMALALGLKERGHQPVIATTNFYREKIESAGFGFAPVRPDFNNQDDIKEIVRKVMDLKKGPETIIRDIVIPSVRESYQDITAAASGADLLISHILTYATPLVAEKQNIPWISTALQPIAFFSQYDDMELAPAPWMSQIRRMAPPVYRALLRLLVKTTLSWVEPIQTLRREEGLPPFKENPIFMGQHSPYLVLALYSKVLASPQRDWPANVVITGFPFYDKHGRDDVSEELDAFLRDGPPPIVFTLGSSAVMNAGSFYKDSTDAALSLGARAILLIGDEPDNRPDRALPKEIGVFRYAPYSEIFPRCSAIVHQGGIGTTGQALQAGRPMLITPVAHDQPDNAARIVRLGVGRTIARARYNAESATRELKPLLQESTYADKAQEVGAIVRSENGVHAACDAIEALIARGR